MKWIRASVVAAVLAACLAVTSSALAAPRAASATGSCGFNVSGTTLTVNCTVNGAQYQCSLGRGSGLLSLNCSGPNGTLACSWNLLTRKASCTPPIPAPPHDD